MKLLWLAAAGIAILFAVIVAHVYTRNCEGFLAMSSQEQSTKLTGAPKQQIPWANGQGPRVNFYNAQV